MLELYQLEAEQQAANCTLSYMALLQDPWPEINLMAPKMHPDCGAAQQQPAGPLGGLGNDNEIALDATQLVQHALGGDGRA